MDFALFPTARQSANASGNREFPMLVIHFWDGEFDFPA
jgi:hypothetical protein